MYLRALPSSRYWLVPSLTTLVLITGLSVATWPHQSLEQQLVPLINDNTNPPTTAQCAKCHREISDQFLQTGHARSLWPGDDPIVLARFANQEYRWTADGPLFRYVAAEDGLWLTQENSPLRLRVDWVLGSGTHTQGPVHLTTNPSGATEMWEHLLAWYPSVGIAPALGNDSKVIAPDGMAALGLWHGNVEAKACLGCHSTHVPLDPAGKIQSDQLVGKVGCVRCHPDASRHVAQNGAIDAFRERWSELSPRTVVDRCGECHRRAAETDPGELESERLDIVRFASVGLSQSRCFQSQGVGSPDMASVRLDCLSCHDLHRPLSKDKNAYQKVCFSCHYDKQAIGRPCKSQPQTSDCLSCHMPVVKTDVNLKFRDHWIRIRKQ